ncbi:hypothetical protein OG417_01885 [Actinoallomurus sp. NBC_01490]|nr:hypothetical protein [Actinoallomurus sp. NBC_01490]
MTRIAPAVVGPKPARPIPILLAASGKRVQRRLIDHADGPVATGVDGRAR